MLIMLASATVFSCVNPDYDLSKGIDTDMTLLKNTSIPLGNVASIPVSDLFGGEDSSVISVDDNGDLSLSFGGGESTTTFNMPLLSMGGEGGLSGGRTTVYFQTGIDDNRVPDNSDQEIHFSDFDQADQNDDDLLETFMEIEIDKELPKEVRDIKVVNMDDAVLKYHFNVSEGSILHLKEGFRIEFPHYMVLEEIDRNDDYTLIDGYVVVFNRDVKLSYDSPLTLMFGFKSVYGHEYDEYGNIVVNLLDMEPIYDEDGKKRATRIFHTDRLDITGDLYLKYADYADAYLPIPSELHLFMNVEMLDLEMTSAELKLDMELAMEPQTIDIAGGSSELLGEDMVLDLYDPAIMLSVRNSSPMEMNVNADITSDTGSGNRTIHIGDSGDSPTDPIIIPADDEMEYVISARGKGSKKSYIKVPAVADMLQDIPESIEIHNVDIESEDRFVEVSANTSFDVTFAYDFAAPLAFGEDLELSFSYDVELGDGSSMMMNSLSLSFDMVNTIPLDFHITGVALDSEGQEIADADVDLDLEILGGDMENPTVSPLELSIRSESVPVTMLRLNFNATVSPDRAGEILNVDQGLDLTNLVITLPDGIDLSLNTNEEN